MCCSFLPLEDKGCLGAFGSYAVQDIGLVFDSHLRNLKLREIPLSQRPQRVCVTFGGSHSGGSKESGLKQGKPELGICVTSLGKR